ncbi:helix-turn-helix transcriptional regulator [Streptomyces canus]|uniref:helix-turn-helix transcriptional regulator n=1 Tax=Streptomyces canus TaxID=58343 RepID=UPI002E252F04|nr:LuxR C-terminal-related transcriptional regulator [Streptomyces canus]
METITFPHLSKTLPLESPVRPGTVPRLLCVDDVQDADVASLRAMTGFARDIQSQPVLLVLGERSTLHHTHRRGLAELAGRPYCRTLHMEQLPPTAVVRMAAQQFGLTLSSSSTAELMQLAGDNLSLLKALLADYQRLREGGAVAPSVPQVPGACYREAVLSCYNRSTAEVREVAQAIAVLDEYSTARSLAEVVGTTPENAARTLTALASAGLVANSRFRHPVASQAILSSIPLQQGSALRRRAAIVLRTMGVQAVKVARVLIAADHTDASWTDFLAQEAAAQALALNDRELAVKTLWLAVRGMSDGARRAETLGQIAEIQSADNPEHCAQCLHEARALIGTDALWQKRSSLLSEQMARRGMATEAVAELETLAGRLDARQLSAHAELEADRLLLCGDYPALTRTSSARLDDPVRTTAFSTASNRFAAVWPLVRMLTSEQPDPAAAEAASKALYHSSFTENSAPAVLAGLSALLYAKEWKLVHSLTDKLVDEAAVRRAPVWQARFLAIRAEASLGEGRYSDAAADSEEAMAMLPTPSWGARFGGPLASLLLARVMTGELSDARRGAAQPLPPASLDTRHGLRFLYARGQVNLAEGRAEAALADFLTCGRLMVAWGVDHEHILPWRLAAAGAQLLRGDQEAAVDLVDERNTRLETLGRPMSADEGYRSAREQLYDVLARAVERGELVESIRTLTLNETAPPSARPARYRIEDRFSRYLNKLTFSERKVAMLAATGSSNRVIARSLSLSISTVEQHLTHTYKKLGVAGRQQLRAMIG